MDRVYNFGAGPSTIPEKVLLEIQKEFLNFNNTGMSITEISHRSSEFMALYDELILNLRTLLNIPDNYEVFFMQGGATLQFSAVPLNLLDKGFAYYISSGFFAKRAYLEATKYGDVRLLASSEDENFTYIPKVVKIDKANYLHVCFNNTIYGTTYNYIPSGCDVVADMSSCILSRPIDVSKFALIYAGCQKNMGVAGSTLVIIRKDLLERSKDNIPLYLNYKIQAENKSMYNTPPVFSLYVTSKIVKYLLSLGGLEEVEKLNLKKASLLYDYLDKSKIFKGVCDKEFRSITNVCYRTKSDELVKEFIKFAKDNGVVGIKGHRLVGGLRASIYNGMPIEGVIKLLNLMKEFEEKYEI